MPDPDLDAAYRATAYEVDAPAGARIVIRIGRHAPALDALLAASGANAWAFITAENPSSTPLEPAANAARRARLEAVLAARGLRFLHGTGRGDDPGWPPEESLLVVGIDEADAVALAREFGQHAIVAGTRGTAARLVWVGPPADVTRA